MPVQTPPRDDYNFTDLDYMTQQQLLDICGQDIITFSEMGAPEKEVLWEKRYVLSSDEFELEFPELSRAKL